MKENLLLMGILMIFLGILLIVIGAILSSRETKVEWGFFGLIGPIPIGAWSSQRALVLTLMILISLIVILILLKVLAWS